MTTAGLLDGADPPTDAVRPAAAGPERIRRWLHPYQVLAYLALGWVLWFFLTTSVPDPPMAPDSWYYYDLSTTVFRDPGRTHTIRAFMDPAPYTAAFPFLYPALIAVVDLATGKGHASGALANLGCLVAAAVALDLAFWRLFGRRGVGPTVVVLLLSFAWFVQDLVGGGSLAMAVMMASVLLAMLARTGTPSTARLVGLGLVAGAAVLVRFDALAVALVLPFALVGVRVWRWRQVPAFLLGLGAGTLPWVVYSLVHFSVPFASDNTIMATSVRRLATVAYAFPGGTRTVLDDPSGWWQRVSGNIGPFASQFVHQLWGAITPPLVATAVLVALGTVRWQGRRHTDDAGRTPTLREVLSHRGVRLFAAWAAAVTIGLAATNIAPGFDVARYFAGGVLAALLLGTSIVLAVPRWPRAASAVPAAALVFLAWFVPTAAVQGSERTPDIILSDLTGIDPQEFVAPVAACLDAGDRVMVVREHAALHVLGPVHGITAVYEPFNYTALTAAERRALLEEYGITALFIDPAWTPEQRRGPLRSHAEALGIPVDELREGCTPGLYRISW